MKCLPREVSNSIRALVAASCFVMAPASPLAAAEPASVIKLWPGKPPGEARELAEEKDFTKPEDKLIAGRRIIKLGNVTTPELHVFLPAADKANGTSVVVCPGGGFTILAWDLEGTEVAEWLNSLGVTAFVLKYRVPGPAKLAVQDAQRAVSLVRSRADTWKLAKDRIGVLGFSAGGYAAALAAAGPAERAYDAVDEADKTSFRPDFAVLVYPGGLLEGKTDRLKSDLAPSKQTPPIFLAHAADDPVTCEASVQLFLALKKAGASGELHVWDAGGHGYGLRPAEGFPVTHWPERCADWLRRGNWLR